MLPMSSKLPLTDRGWPLRRQRSYAAGQVSFMQRSSTSPSLSSSNFVTIRPLACEAHCRSSFLPTMPPLGGCGVDATIG